MGFAINEMKSIERESMSFCAATKTTRQGRERSDWDNTKLLIIVDLQQDFGGDRPMAVPNAEAIARMNHELAMNALAAGVAVIVARDWHPHDHFSFHTWPRHGVVNTDGAEFMPEFNIMELEKSVQFADIGADNGAPDYNPFYDPEFDIFMSERAPEAIYVTGIALEYCVLATCLAAQAYSDKIIALEDYIQPTKAENAGFAWDILASSGVEKRKGNPFA